MPTQDLALINAFDLPDTPKEKKNFPMVVDDPYRDKAEDEKSDYEIVRNTLRNTLETGYQSLQAIAELATAQENPAAFDSISKMMKSLVEATNALKDLHSEKHEDKKTIKQTVTQHIDKAVIMSPEDAFRRIKE